MAKKKDTFSYGASAIPSGETKYSVIRWGWNGLNRTDDIDTGQITDCEGIVVDPPQIYPAASAKLFLSYDDPQAIFGFGDRLLVVYNTGANVKIDSVTPTRQKFTGTVGDSADFKYRSAVQFNVAANTENIVEAEFDRKILLFPDSCSMDFSPDADFTPASLGSAYPGLMYAAVYGSRVFGVDDDLVYASSYNDYADWDLDTADEYSEANAWVSMSQSNAKADGKFTAVAVYDNHVVLFKSDFMQLVYNNKNPFRIVDVGSYGCDNAYAVTEADGVLYFASCETVYAYGGGVPRDIGKSLEIDSYRGAVLGAYKNRLFLYVQKKLYSYRNGVWSCMGHPGADIRQFAALDYGLAALMSDGRIVFVDWSDSMVTDLTGETWADEFSGEWWFECDLMALGKLDIRRVKKFSLLCEAEEGAVVRAYLMRDGEKFEDGGALLVGSLTGSEKKTVIMRVMTRQLSGYMHRIRIAGRGYVKILAAELKISWGGDVYAEG